MSKKGRVLKLGIERVKSKVNAFMVGHRQARISIASVVPEGRSGRLKERCKPPIWEDEHIHRLRGTDHVGPITHTPHFTSVTSFVSLQWLAF